MTDFSKQIVDGMLNNQCPRRVLEGSSPGLPDTNEWMSGSNVCSHCGSMHPDDFFKAIDDGAEIVPTDKNYKAYVRSQNWVQKKFYFQHMSYADREKLVEYINNDKIKFAVPGHFYVPPFFVGFRTKEDKQES